MIPTASAMSRKYGDLLGRIARPVLDDAPGIFGDMLALLGLGVFIGSLCLGLIGGGAW